MGHHGSQKGCPFEALRAVEVFLKQCLDASGLLPLSLQGSQHLLNHLDIARYGSKLDIQ